MIWLSFCWLVKQQQQHQLESVATTGPSSPCSIGNYFEQQMKLGQLDSFGASFWWVLSIRLFFLGCRQKPEGRKHLMSIMMIMMMLMRES
jgi:hypothetical protein